MNENCEAAEDEEAETAAEVMAVAAAAVSASPARSSTSKPPKAASSAGGEAICRPANIEAQREQKAARQKAEKELIRQYGFMRHVFTKARFLLDGSDSDRFNRRVLRALGRAALDEGAEWLLMHRQRPLEHGRL